MSQYACKNQIATIWLLINILSAEKGLQALVIQVVEYLF